jgi:hypothetical protein
MFRTLTASVLAALMLSTVSVGLATAEERPTGTVVAPNAIVAKAWAKEAGGSSAAVKTLFVTYGVVQGLDMASTMMARNRGAIEANPVMAGSYGKGMAVKAALGGMSYLAVRAIEKKSKKAAVITMIAMNVGTAAVVAHNLRNAKRLR